MCMFISAEQSNDFYSTKKVAIGNCTREFTIIIIIIIIISFRPLPITYLQNYHIHHMTSSHINKRIKLNIVHNQDNLKAIGS